MASKFTHHCSKFYPRLVGGEVVVFDHSATVASGLGRIEGFDVGFDEDGGLLKGVSHGGLLCEGLIPTWPTRRGNVRGGDK